MKGGEKEKNHINVIIIIRRRRNESIIQSLPVNRRNRGNTKNEGIVIVDRHRIRRSHTLPHHQCHLGVVMGIVIIIEGNMMEGSIIDIIPKVGGGEKMMIIPHLDIVIEEAGVLIEIVLERIDTMIMITVGDAVQGDAPIAIIDTDMVVEVGAIALEGLLPIAGAEVEMRRSSHHR